MHKIQIPFEWYCLVCDLVFAQLVSALIAIKYAAENRAWLRLSSFLF